MESKTILGADGKLLIPGSGKIILRDTAIPSSFVLTFAGLTNCCFGAPGFPGTKLVDDMNGDYLVSFYQCSCQFVIYRFFSGPGIGTGVNYQNYSDPDCLVPSGGVLKGNFLIEMTWDPVFKYVTSVLANAIGGRVFAAGSGCDVAPAPVIRTTTSCDDNQPLDNGLTGCIDTMGIYDVCTACYGGTATVS